MAPKELPDADYLHQCLAYDTANDRLTYRDRPRSHFRRQEDFLNWNRRFSGRQAGAINKSGYRVISLHNQRYYAHRVIWKMTVGTEPPSELDHRNRHEADNLPLNVRPATRSQQMGNTRTHRDNIIGLKGVTKHGKKFRATIRAHGTTRRLGVYITPEEAHAAYCEAAKELFGEYWNPG